MNVIGDVLKELFSMFVADSKLTGAVLALVAFVAAWMKFFPALEPTVPGLVLLLGCVAIIVAITTLHARRSP